MLSDLRLALRRLLRSSGFKLSAVLLASLGVQGAITKSVNCCANKVDPLIAL